MSDIGMDELPEDVGKLLEDARELRGPSDAVREKMRGRLLAALPPPGPMGGGGGGGPSGAGGSFFPRVPAWVAAATFAAGLAAGVGLRPSAPAATTPLVGEPARIVTQAEGPKPSAVPTLAATDLPLVAPNKPSPIASTPAHGSTSHASDLAAERAVLDVARTALGRGDAENALSAATEHAKKFPRGALSEEREAIAVQALAAGGRKDEARARAERFKKAHPDSILLPAVLASGGVE